MKVFISHATEDNLLAYQILRFTRLLGYKNTFMDFDPEFGLNVGENLTYGLAENHLSSDCFVHIVSEFWLNSSWCQGEFRAALLNKQPQIPIIIGDRQTKLKLEKALGEMKGLHLSDPGFSTRYVSALSKQTLITNQRKTRLNQGGDSYLGKSEQSLFQFSARTRVALLNLGFELVDIVEDTKGLINFIGTKRDSQLGFSKSKIAISCWLNLQDDYTFQAYEKLIPVIESLAQKYKLDGVIMVTSQIPKFQEEFNSLNKKIKFVELGALEMDGLHINEYFDGIANQYKSFQNAEFIDLESTTPDFEIDNTASFITGNLLEQEKAFHFLTGDFGSGKTTIAESIHSRISEEFQKGKTALFPMIFYLRTLSQFENIDQFVANQTSACSPKTPQDLLFEMKKRGPLLIVLDGFDEVASSSTKSERLMYFERVFELMEFCTHMVLTSRPTAFSNKEELRDLMRVLIQDREKSSHDFFHVGKRRRKASLQDKMDINKSLVNERVHKNQIAKFSSKESLVFKIRPLSAEKIILFFSRFESEIYERHEKTPKEIYEFLLGIYDLTDMLTRPLLLDMFTDILLKGRINLDDPNLEVGPLSLYQIYINLHLKREDAKSRFLSADARLEFSKTVAVAMLHSGGKLEASIDTIYEVIKNSPTMSKVLPVELKENHLEKVATDLRVCGFLKITDDNKIAFSHKSFMEYFVADVIHEKISKNEHPRELEYPLNYETLQFLGAFAHYKTDFSIAFDRMSKAARYSETTIGNHLRVASFFKKPDLDNENFKNIDFSGIKFKRKSFDLCGFQNVNLQKAEFDEVVFENCNFIETKFSGSFYSVEIKACVGNLDLIETLSNIHIAESRLRSRTVSSFTNSSIENSNLELESPNNTKIVHTNISGSIVKVRHDKTTTVSNSTLSNCLFYFESINAVTLNKLFLSKDKSPLILESTTKSELSVCGMHVSSLYFKNNISALSKFHGYIIVSDPAQTIDQLRSGLSRNPKNDGYAGYGKIGSLFVLSSDWLASNPNFSDSKKRYFDHTFIAGEELCHLVDSWIKTWFNAYFKKRKWQAIEWSRF